MGDHSIMKVVKPGMFANVTCVEKLSSVQTTYVNTPATIPAQPNPDTARPTTNAADVGAVAESKDPTSKIKSAIKKTPLIE